MSSHSGTLQCAVEFARGLLDKEWFGKQDPYALLELGTQKFRTKTHKDGGTSPVWEETFTFKVGTESELNVTVKDENWGKDTSLGSAVISLATVRARGEERIQAALHLKNHKEKGVVSLLLKFTPEGVSAVSAAAVRSAAGGLMTLPLQQGAVSVTALPGYGSFLPAGAPAPSGLPYGAPAAAVYGLPLIAAGTPSPYSAKPPFPPPPAAPPNLQPQLNQPREAPHGFRSAPLSDGPAASESEGGRCKSTGLSTSACGANGTDLVPTPGASAAAAKSPPPPLPDLQSLNVEDACGSEPQAPGAAAASASAASMSVTAAAEPATTAAKDAAASPAATLGHEGRAPAVWDSAPVESALGATLWAPSPAKPQPRPQPWELGLDPDGLGQQLLPMRAQESPKMDRTLAERDQKATAASMESLGRGPEPQPHSQSQPQLEPSAALPMPPNASTGSAATLEIDTTAPSGFQVRATVAPVSAAQPQPPQLQPASLQSPLQNDQHQQQKMPFQTAGSPVGPQMPSPYCASPPYNAANPYGTPYGVPPLGNDAARPYGIPEPPQLPSPGQPLAWPAPQAARPPKENYAGYPPYGPAPTQLPTYTAVPPPGYPVEQRYGQSPSLLYGQPAGYGGYSTSAGYPPAPVYFPNPYGYPSFGLPPPGNNYAEEDRMARHALPRYGTGKASPKRHR